MKKLIKSLGAILTTFLIFGCAEKEKQPIEPKNNGVEQEKEKPDIPEVTPQEFYCHISKYDDSTRYGGATITYRIKESSEGSTNVTLNNGQSFPSEPIESTIIIEITPDKFSNLTVFDVASENNIQTSYTSFLEESTPLTVKDWENYHNECRLKENTNEHIFEERLFINPCITYLRDINHLDNYTLEVEESRKFNDDGFVSNIEIYKEYLFYNNDNLVGKYKISCDGKVEYLEKDLSDLSPEDFEEQINAINYGTYVKANVEYTIRECLIGSVPGVANQNNEPLADGAFLSAKVSAVQTPSYDLTYTFPESTQFSYDVRQIISSSNVASIKAWLSYHKQRRPTENTVWFEGEGMYEKLYHNPYKMWMKTVGKRIPNSNIEGSFYGFEEYDRTFEENGLVNYVSFREYEEIDGIFSRYDTEPKYYKGKHFLSVEAHITYEFE